jgi:predicted NBD/HSP70 family sugar kinase
VDAQGADVRQLRRHNAALLLDHMLRFGDVRQGMLAAATGLTQQAVSKILADLSAAGLIERVRQPAVDVGKPPSIVRLRPQSRCALGAQLDRDGYTMVRTGLTGQVEDVTVGSLRAGFTPAQAISALHRAARTLLRDVPDERVLGLGVGTVGPVDHRTGRIRRATNMAGWTDVPLRDLLARRTGLPVMVDKDTSTAALAHCRPHPDIAATAVVLVGTGIGAGLIIDGKVFRGSRSGAGEFGHVTLDRNGPRCACGRRGCLEVLHQQAATTAMRARLLGVALTDLVRILDIERVVLFGRAIRADPQAYESGVIGVLRETQPPPHAVEVEISSEDETAAAVGAAWLPLSAFLAQPLLS